MRIFALALSLRAALVVGGVDRADADKVQVPLSVKDVYDAFVQESGDDQEEAHATSNTTAHAQATPGQRLAALWRHQRAWNARWRSGRRSYLAKASRRYRSSRSRAIRSQVAWRRNLRRAYGRQVMAQWRAKRPNAVIRVVRAFQRRHAAARRAHAAALRRQRAAYVSRVRRFASSQALRWRRRQAWYRQRRGLLIQLRNIRRAVGRTARTMRVVRSRSAAWRRRWSAAVRGRMAHYNRVLRARLTRAVRQQVVRRRSLRAAYGRVVMRQWRAKQPNNVIRTVRRFQAALNRSNSAHSRRLGALRRGIVNAKRRYRAGQNKRLASYNKRVRASLSRLGRTIRSLRSRASRVRRSLKSNQKRKVAF
eukprot:CAMPEP_0204393574 /NCGR_PEP_ID=MMETSP0469-20131031/62388_1 /ASSEMBLY_ACC=CAM_ASM_000384 /TAXON_ID=2969 /ORGANISM="Oxyrrhis marina" /LENGTH=364 /DNA_ID=CAMNT_0051387651 /DNA_START=93 /DNA_END=1187 /DNA_ORIENTATION=-